MDKSVETRRQYKEGLMTAISIGFLLLLIGTLFVINPDLFGSILDFFEDFKLVDVPYTNIVFPAPELPILHRTVYEAARQFSIALGILQIIILALRFLITSSWGKRSDTMGNFIFWVGTGFLIQLFLIETTQWFPFWSMIIILAGISIIVRAVVMAVARI